MLKECERRTQLGPSLSGQPKAALHAGELDIAKGEFEAAEVGVVVLPNGVGDIERGAGSEIVGREGFSHVPSKGIERDGVAPVGTRWLSGSGLFGGADFVAAESRAVGMAPRGGENRFEVMGVTVFVVRAQAPKTAPGRTAQSGRQT